MIKKIPLATMGAHPPGSAKARPSTPPPINTSGNLLVQVLGGGGGDFRFSLIQAILSTFLRPPWGQGEAPQICFTPNLIFFCDLKPNAKFREPYNSFWEKSNARKRIKRTLLLRPRGDKQLLHPLFIV
jgi:hypothetical protein